jgi:IS5 family transposase
MIRDHYPAEQLAPLLTPDAVWRIDPVLAVLDPLLDDDQLVAQVKADLVRRTPQSASRGRPSTPVAVILRMLLLRRLYDWSYEETERLVWDSVSLRQFCRIGGADVPDDTTLIRWAACIQPATMEQLTARVVQVACERRVTRGRNLRVDGTVVETTIHHPSDSSLLVDGVRMLSRLAGQARATGMLPGRVVRNYTRGARRLGRQIGEAVRKDEAVRQRLYQRLLRITRTTLGQAHAVHALLPDPLALRQRLATLIALTEQVVEQTTRRVLQGDPVPAAEKLVSLTEPHTAILQRSKPQRQTEYGHRIVLGESEGGIVTTYQVLPGTEAESPQLQVAVTQHEARTGRMPEVLATDAGFHAPGQTECLEQQGIRRVVIPVQGKTRPARERTQWFRRGRRFRVGIEGRISVCKRRGWLGRCRDHGMAGFQRWIGWGILANNLVAIARAEEERDRQQAA